MSVTELASLAASLTTHDGSRSSERAEGSPDDPTSRRASTYGLTPREVEILRLLIFHHSYREIADVLYQPAHDCNTHQLDQ